MVGDVSNALRGTEITTGTGSAPGGAQGEGRDRLRRPRRTELAHSGPRRLARREARRERRWQLVGRRRRRRRCRIRDGTRCTAERHPRGKRRRPWTQRVRPRRLRARAELATAVLLLGVRAQDQPVAGGIRVSRGHAHERRRGDRSSTSPSAPGRARARRAEEVRSRASSGLHRRLEVSDLRPRWRDSVQLSRSRSAGPKRANQRKPKRSTLKAPRTARRAGLGVSARPAGVCRVCGEGIANSGARGRASCGVRLLPRGDARSRHGESRTQNRAGSHRGVRALRCRVTRARARSSCPEQSRARR